MMATMDYKHEQQIAKLEKQLLETQAQVEVMRQKAQAVIDRWETPKWKDVEPTADFIYALRDVIDILPPEALQQYEASITAPLQAKIDWLMLEFCPEEMTQEQMDNWAKHQRPARMEK